VLDGALEHFDSAGNTGVIYAGDAQWMTTGRGVVHNENPLPGTTTYLPVSRRYVGCPEDA
jgi:quercetin 2,3-dioxygenase